MNLHEDMLSKLLKIFFKSFQLDFSSNDHFGFIDKEVFKMMLRNKSKLSDAFLDFKDIENFCKTIFKKSNSIDFNHLGFCYQAESKNRERIRLSEVAKNKGLYLYEMSSNDFALWLFIGDISNPKDPVIEFLPVEKVNDYYVDYWLPHIHFAFHTNLTAMEIKYTTHEVFEGIRSANPSVVFENVIYQLRIWLGTIAGINFCLDLSTKAPGNSLLETRRLLEKSK